MVFTIRIYRDLSIRYPPETVRPERRHIRSNGMTEAARGVAAGEGRLRRSAVRARAAAFAALRPAAAPEAGA